MIAKYWALYTDEIDGFVDGSMVARDGVAGQPQRTPRRTHRSMPSSPSEGVTGWADTWMMSANAPHPNCMLMWMEYTLRPEVQAEVAEFYGAAGSNTESCEPCGRSWSTLGEGADAAVDTLEQATAGTRRSWIRSTCGRHRRSHCGDDRGDVCIDYSAWTQKWTEIRGVVAPTGVDGAASAAPGPPSGSGGRVASDIARTRAGIAVRRASAFLFRHPPAKLGLSLGAPLAWIVRGLPRIARAPAGVGVLASSTPSRPRSSRTGASTTSDTLLDDRRLPHDHAADGRDRRRRHDRPTSCSRSRSPTTRPGWRPRARVER